MGESTKLLDIDNFNFVLWLFKIDIMKKAILYICAITFLASSCSKDNDPPPPPTLKSEWTVDGVLYKGIAKPYLNSLFEAAEILPNGLNSGNLISISFNYQYWPATSGIYKVKRAPANNAECSIKVAYPNSSDNFNSVDSNSEVNVVVSSGKLKASFSNVVLSNYDGTQTRTASGTLEEQ
jgi:hypothetical protein